MCCQNIGHAARYNDLIIRVFYKQCDIHDGHAVLLEREP